MTDKTSNHYTSAMRCPQQLADVDLFSPGAQEHWYEAYALLHQQAPVHKLAGEGLGGRGDGYILSKYQDIAQVVRDPQRFPPTLSLLLQQMARAESPVPGSNAMTEAMLTLRPTEQLWRSHRKELTDPWVGPGAGRHQAMIEACTHELIDSWIDKPEIDFVAEFARPLPQRVLAKVLGFPQQDIGQLALWGQAQVAAFVYGKGHRNILTKQQSTEQAIALQGFKDYVQEVVAQKRRQPEDDMISFLTQVHYQALDRKLTDLEINGVVYAMVIGGLETTQYALDQQAQLLCDSPDLFALLKANPTKIRNFTEEAMRLRAPTQGLSTRITRQDEVFQGVPVAKGSLLHLRWAAGNVDATEFANPDQLQLERKAIGRHLSFSAGPRVCPGAGISRLEQLTAWQVLLQRLECMSYAPGNAFSHQPGIMLGTLALKLNFKAAG